MNNLPRRILRLVAIGAFAIAVPQLAAASDFENSAPFRLAMGPMSAAQKNQGTPAKSDDVVTKPPHRTTHRHKHHAQ
jgi:hypothetical protein